MQDTVRLEGRDPQVGVVRRQTDDAGMVPHGVGVVDVVDVESNDILLKKWRNAPIDKQRQREKLMVLKVQQMQLAEIKVEAQQLVFAQRKLAKKFVSAEARESCARACRIESRRAEVGFYAEEA